MMVNYAIKWNLFGMAYYSMLNQTNKTYPSIMRR